MGQISAVLDSQSLLARPRWLGRTSYSLSQSLARLDAGLEARFQDRQCFLQQMPGHGERG